MHESQRFRSLVEQLWPLLLQEGPRSDEGEGRIFDLHVSDQTFDCLLPNLIIGWPRD